MKKEYFLDKETHYNKKVSSYLEEALKEEIMAFEQLWSDVIQEKISGLEVSQNLYSDIENANRELTQLFVDFENERNNLPRFCYTNYKYQIEI